jgi:hypothetical protein
MFKLAEKGQKNAALSRLLQLFARIGYAYDFYA